MADELSNSFAFKREKSEIMEVIYYFIGIILAIVLMIYFVDMSHRIQDGKLLKGDKKPLGEDTSSVAKEAKLQYRYPRAKVCPLCKAELEQHDVLVATIFDEVNESGRQRVLIHGCKYCNQRESKESAETKENRDGHERNPREIEI